MKKLLIILMFFCSTNGFAQDIIVKKDGSTIAAKVLEITQNEIKYKKFNNQNGPIYNILKTEVFSINYSNGSKDVFNSTNSSEVNRSINYTRNTNNQINKGLQIQKDQLLVSADNWEKAGVFLGTLIGVGGGLSSLLFLDGTASYIVAGSCLGAGALTAMICGGIANNKRDEANVISSIPIIKQDLNFGNYHISACVNCINDKQIKRNIIGLGFEVKF